MKINHADPAKDEKVVSLKSEMKFPVVINLQEPWIVCSVCGEEDVSRWGLAVCAGQIVPDDYQGDWGGAPCCEECYAAWRCGTIKLWMTFNQAALASARAKQQKDAEKKP